MKKGLRHHCRKCGGVVCTSCYSCKEKLKVYVDRDDSVKVWVNPSKTHSPPAFTVCKRCHTQVMEELRVTKALSQKRPNVFCQLCGMPCMKKTIPHILLDGSIQCIHLHFLRHLPPLSVPHLHCLSWVPVAVAVVVAVAVACSCSLRLQGAGGRGLHAAARWAPGRWWLAESG